MLLLRTTRNSRWTAGTPAGQQERKHTSFAGMLEDCRNRPCEDDHLLGLTGGSLCLSDTGELRADWPLRASADPGLDMRGGPPLPGCVLPSHPAGFCPQLACKHTALETSGALGVLPLPRPSGQGCGAALTP